MCSTQIEKYYTCTIDSLLAYNNSCDETEMKKNRVQRGIELVSYWTFTIIHSLTHLLTRLEMRNMLSR